MNLKLSLKYFSSSKFQIVLLFNFYSYQHAQAASQKLHVTDSVCVSHAQKRDFEKKNSFFIFNHY